MRILEDLDRALEAVEAELELQGHEIARLNRELVQLRGELKLKASSVHYHQELVGLHKLA